MPTLKFKKEPGNQFNKNYGVNFNIDEYNSKARAFDDEEYGLNTTYQAEFIRLYKKAISNFIDGKITDFNPMKMLSDFETNVMGSYRKECIEKFDRNIDVPSGYGGLDKREMLTLMQEAVRDIPANRIQYAAQRYKGGDIRIRDMMAFSNEVLGKGVVDREKFATMVSYAEALKQVNESRSFVWRVFHPIRNRAEQRNAQTIADIIDKVGGGGGFALNEYGYMQALGDVENPDENRIGWVNDKVGAEVTKLNLDSESKAQKFSMSINEALEDNKTERSPYQRSSDVPSKSGRDFFN